MEEEKHRSKKNHGGQKAGDILWTKRNLYYPISKLTPPLSFRKYKEVNPYKRNHETLTRFAHYN